MNGNLMPLSMLNIGEEAELVDVRGGRGLRKRLSALGLNPGMKVTVVQNTMRGPIVLGVMDSRIALGRGMAHRILVSQGS
jgi:ferrous iron transport protein A